MKTYVIPLLSLLLATGCKKEKTELEKLPAATQEGKNTAGFLLNGKAWVPEASKLIGSGSAVSANWQPTVAGNSLSFGFSRDSDQTTAQFFIPHIQQAGAFQLNQTANTVFGFRNPAYSMFIMSKSLLVPRIFLTNPSATGTLIITRFDTVTHVVAGTFDVTVQEENGTETH